MDLMQAQGVKASVTEQRGAQATSHQVAGRKGMSRSAARSLPSGSFPLGPRTGCWGQ